jgi:hypothetical protein
VKFLKQFSTWAKTGFDRASSLILQVLLRVTLMVTKLLGSKFSRKFQHDERGDVPGWVLVVLMTTGLVTAIWTIAAPRLSAILRNSLDSMNGIR